MSILSDIEIAALCDEKLEKPMIVPFVNKQVRRNANDQPVISFGPDSYGYDITPGEDFKIFSNHNTTLIDPKRLDEKCLQQADIKIDEDGSRYVILPPNGYALSKSPCVFNMPANVMGITLAKSTYARSGVVIPTTVLRAGWSGELVLEIANNANLPVKIYIDEGVVSILFFGGLNESSAGYVGVYQNQRGVRLPGVDASVKDVGLKDSLDDKFEVRETVTTERSSGETIVAFGCFRKRDAESAGSVVCTVDEQRACFKNFTVHVRPEFQYMGLETFLAKKSIRLLQRLDNYCCNRIEAQPCTVEELNLLLNVGFASFPDGHASGQGTKVLRYILGEVGALR